jgi:DNA-binding response OmpR family regulator
MRDEMTAGDQPGSETFKIVVVEDIGPLAASIAKTLEKEGFETRVAVEAGTGLDLARSLPADLVVLDVSLPGMSGVEACGRLRMFSDAYVIMLTALSGESDRLAALAAGADDYMTKPFYPRELVARIRAMQERPRTRIGAPHVRRLGGLEIDLDRQRVKVDGATIELSRTEFRLLAFLSAQPERTISREALVDGVWGDAWVGDDHIIDVNMSNLRRKLGDSHHIATVRGFGYRMSEG